jgi:hypothetical protein
LLDLLGSTLIALLLSGDSETPAYFSSPWMSDFALLSNHFREVVALFPDTSEHTEIRFTEYLARLADARPVRIITTDTDTSRKFLDNLAVLGSLSNVEVRLARQEYHEKGILAPSFYIEGSMNLTYSGVYVRDEKITYHSASDPAGLEKVGRAYLEFNRRWNSLTPARETR